MRRILLIITLILCCNSRAFAADPVLCFTDLIDGPKTGIGDGLGSGAVVTVWGWNLGSSQGASTITVDGVSAAYVYYWGNADGTSGPANLYVKQKLQEIAFSIPSGASDGAVKIKATVGGVASNELDFTIRSGSIFWVASGGSNSNDGSYGSPWATIGYGTGGAVDKGTFTQGSILYAKDSITVGSTVSVRTAIGAAGNQYAFIAYPGVDVDLVGFANAYPYTASYWVVSKVTAHQDDTVISPGTGWRIVGCNLSDDDCATGQGGVISTNGDQGLKGGVESDLQLKIFGNDIHDYGGSCTTSLHHVLYVSNRGKDVVYGSDGQHYQCLVDHTSSSDGAVDKPITGSDWASYWEFSPNTATVSNWAANTAYDKGKIQAYEVGWNYLHNNQARNSMHFYDEVECGDFFGTLSIHHNYEDGGSAAGLDLVAYTVTAGGTPCITCPVKIYSNVIINNGQAPHNTYAGFQIFGQGLTSTIDVYNNLIGGYHGTDAQTQWPSGGSAPLGGTLNFVNNAMFDTDDTYWEINGYPNKTTGTRSNNLLWDGGNSLPASVPASFNSPLTSDPLFTNQAGGDYTPESSSPLFENGTSYLSGVSFGQYGVDGSLLTNDIGAYGSSTTSNPVVHSGGVIFGGMAQ